MSAGLFEIRFSERPSAPEEESDDLQPANRAEPLFRQAGERGLHRFCSGCSRQTEHLLAGSSDRSEIPAIRLPAAEPPSGTTICVDCGQWRAPASLPNAPTWSFWPRTAG